MTAISLDDSLSEDAFTPRAPWTFVYPVLCAGSNVVQSEDGKVESLRKCQIHTALDSQIALYSNVQLARRSHLLARRAPTGMIRQTVRSNHIGFPCPFLPRP